MIAEIKVIGRMDHTIDNTYESANRIYSQYALCPTISTNVGGDHLPKILEGEENMSERQNGIKAKNCLTEISDFIRMMRKNQQYLNCRCRAVQMWLRQLRPRMCRRYTKKSR